jgi:outer membrane protein OmpA-like peptidoglycan-associated protein
MRGLINRVTGLISTSALLLGLLAAVPLTFSFPTAANAAACVTAGSTQNNITVEPSHGRTMYIDSGVSPRLDAAYIGYRITNSTGAALNGYWASATNFTGGVVSLAYSRDQYLRVPDLAINQTKTVYFLIKASTSTRVAQTHTFKVWSSRPDITGASSPYSCDFSFTKVAETIKASANKVTSITISGADQSPSVGQLVTVTAKGATGTIGAGNPDVGRILWFSPSAFSTFPTASLRLESVKLVISDNTSISGNGNNNLWIYDERLLVTPSITPSADASTNDENTTADNLVGKRYYENIYKFRVIARAPASTPMKPVAQISSGTQIKHTDVGDIATTTANSINTTVSPINLTVTKTAALSGLTETVSSVVYSRINYTVTLTSSSGTVTVDEVVDTPGAGFLFKTGSAQRAGTAIADPVKLTSEASLNPQPFHFVGPFSVTSGTALLITYTMLVPRSFSTVFTNTAVAYSGIQPIGSGASTISGATVTNGGDGAPTGTGTVVINLDPVVTTFNATSIGVTTAVLNGTVDGNGQTPSAQFEWATNSSLAGFTTISASASVAGSDPTALTSNFTGTSGTTYWYRIVAIKSGVRYPGEIVSFTLVEPASTSVATTNNASSILTTSAVLNGSVDPNLQSITEVRFIWGTSDSLSGAATKILYELTEEGADTSTKVTLTGANPIDLDTTLTGLTNNVTYYFRIQAIYTAGGSVQTVSGGIRSFKTGTSAQTITFNALTDQSFTAPFNYTVTATASSTLAITYTSETTSVCTVNASTGVVTFVTAGTCVITASQNGDATRAPAESVSQQFEITPVAPVATTNAASDIGLTAATLNGAITTGGSTDTAATFTYSTNSTLSSGNTTVTAVQSPLTANGSVSFPLTGLSSNTIYYFRVTGTNANSAVSGNILSFTTLTPTAITIDAVDHAKDYLAANPTFSFAITSGALTSPDAISGVTYTFASAGGTPSYGPSTTIPTEGGTYTITPSVAIFSTGSASSYTITYTTGTYTINQIAQATLTSPDRTLSQNSTYTVVATGGSGSGAITYTVQSGSNCTIASGNQLTTSGVDGSCVIRAVKAADRNYLISNNADATMTVNSAQAQTITFADPADRAFSPTPFTVSPTASSTLVVTLTSTTTTICTVEVGTFNVTMLKAGVCSLTGSQAGGTVSSTTFNAAEPVSQSFTISKAARTIDMKSSTDGDAFVLSYVAAGYANWGLTAPTQKSLASAGDSDTKIYSLDGTSSGCELDANGTTRLVGAGTCKVKVSISGDSYADAESSVISFVIGKKNQTISFTALNAMTVGGANQAMTSTTDASGLTVTLTVDPASNGICEIVSGQIRALAAGTCTINSNQAGNVNFNPATQVQRSFTVSAAPSNPPPSVDPAPAPAPAPKEKPAVVWKNPNAIKTTTTLSNTQLNAVATTAGSVTPTISNPKSADKLPSSAPTIAGTYVYTPIVTAVVASGTTQTTTIISVATAISGSTKSSTPTTPTTPTTPMAENEKPVLGQGTALAPGLHKMKVVFIPTDSTRFEPVETEVEILVQAETKVDWVEPAPIKKNTPVGPAQFNATGSAPGVSNNVPGTYKYDIPEGQTFAPGKYPVKVIFTPTDPNFLPSETTVTLTVIADINPLATPIVTPSNTPAARPITNTTPAANARVVNVGRGLTSAVTDGSQVSIVPIVTFSGRTTVRVSVTDEGETKEIDVPVTVLPLPAATPTIRPNNRGSSTIAWSPSINAVQYEVTVAGAIICTTSATSCNTPALIGPSTDVKIVVKGNDETLSPVIPARYTAPAKPVTALVVYFDTNKFNLDAKDRADIRAVAKVIIAQGFKNIVVNGHTDIRGGVDNQVLSRNRSNSTFNYLRSLVPGLNVTIGAFASTRPAVRGTTSAALASNRRAEVGVF